MTICESCGIPLDQTKVSQHSTRYCSYCQDQTTGELISEEQARAGSVEALMHFFGKTREEAENTVNKMMSSLPRWQTMGNKKS